MSYIYMKGGLAQQLVKPFRREEVIKEVQQDAPSARIATALVPGGHDSHLRAIQATTTLAIQMTKRQDGLSFVLQELLDDYEYLVGEGGADDEPMVTEEAWARLALTMEDIFSRLPVSQRIPEPSIDPAPSGGVQLLWQSADRYVMVAIPADGGEPIWYVRSRKGQDSRGPLVDEEFKTVIANLVA